MRLQAIKLYPVKSLGGLAVTTAEVEKWGLRHDRRWLAMDADGSVLTARDERRMLRVTATPRDDGSIMLAGPDGAGIHVEVPLADDVIPTQLSRAGFLRRASPVASSWLSDQIGRQVSLAWMDDPRRRSVSPKHGGQAGDALSLADAGPLLLTTTASLRRLNEWVAEGAAGREEAPKAMVMERFRPNVVVDGLDEGFIEDGWGEMQIGSARFRFAERCDRCMLTLFDPETLAMGKEPLRTLARHRRWDHKVFFGIRVIPIALGTIHVGDSVTAI